MHALNKLPYSKLDSKSVGIREGVVFSTYSSLIASSEKGRSRLQQLVQWCGPEFDGLIIFDEVQFSIWTKFSTFCTKNCILVKDFYQLPNSWKETSNLLHLAILLLFICSVTRQKIWSLKLGDNQHELVKLYLKSRFVFKLSHWVLVICGFHLNWVMNLKKSKNNNMRFAC